MPMPSEPRMYVIVRKELSDSYRMVQGAHALASYSLKYPASFKKWNNEYLIFLGTFLPEGLKQIKEKLFEEKVKFAGFFEPDLNQETALCVFFDPERDDAHKIWNIVKGLSLA